MKSQGVKHISECFIKPKIQVESSKQPYYLSTWELPLLGGHYNQKGLFFMKPNNGSSFSMEKLLENLKDSLALTLVHFYPLAGQLNTIVDHDRHGSLIYVDCNKGPGVRFVHATLDDVAVSNIISPTDHYTPSVVKSFFDHSNGEVNYDGHSRPLLTVQVTELIDGIFIGCSMNHVIVDGTSFWHFWNIWSQIHQAGGTATTVSISRPPIINSRWVPEGYNPADFFLPYVHPNEFIHRYEPLLQPDLRERVFHFTSEKVTALKAKANSEISHAGVKLSSFQALMGLVWRCIIRAKGLDSTRATHCKLMMDNRRRFDPPLPVEDFGNSVSLGIATTKVGELLQQGIGSAALLLSKVVANHTDKTMQKYLRSWLESPYVYNLGKFAEVDDSVQVGSSPRFPVYENRFGELGKPVAVRSGCANKFGGKVIAYPGCEGEGSVDLEIVLHPQAMSTLELDDEFMAYVSPSST